MKQLLLCRHAKSSWKDADPADIDRPLNKRGKCNGLLMGERFAARAMIPELILCSPAKRARKTAARFCRAMQVWLRIPLNDAIYGASVSELLFIINSVDDLYDRIMLIGRNCDLSGLAQELAGFPVGAVIPSCGVVGCGFDVASRQNVPHSRAELLFFDYSGKSQS